MRVSFPTAVHCLVLSWSPKFTEKEPPTQKQLIQRFYKCVQFCPFNIYIMLYKTSRHTVKKKHLNKLNLLELIWAKIISWNGQHSKLHEVLILHPQEEQWVSYIQYGGKMEEWSDWPQLASWDTWMGMTWHLPYLDMTQCQVLNYVTTDWFAVYD